MSDREMTALAEFEARLQSRLGGQIRDLRLTAQEDGFVLHGYAHTYYAKQLAQHVALDLSGLRMLANEINVVQLPVSAARRR